MLDFAATPKTADPGAWKCDWIKDPFNRLLSSTKSGQTTTYQYDGRGNQVRKTEPGAVTSYTYDSRNVMTEMTLPAGQVNRYGYDSQNLRVATDDNLGTRRILLDGLEEYAEYDASSGSQVARYDHDPLRVDGLLTQVNGQGKHYFNIDALGSVYGMTGSSGTLATAYSYDAYGVRTASLEATSTKWSFSGRSQDAGEIYARARHYDPSDGRWLSADPIGFGGGVNRYNYVGGSPTSLVDPLGLFGLFSLRNCDGAQTSLLQGALLGVYGVDLDLLRYWGFWYEGTGERRGYGSGRIDRRMVYGDSTYMRMGRKFFSYKERGPKVSTYAVFECACEDNKAYVASTGHDTQSIFPLVTLYAGFWKENVIEREATLGHELVHAALQDAPDEGDIVNITIMVKKAEKFPEVLTEAAADIAGQLLGGRYRYIPNGLSAADLSP